MKSVVLSAVATIAVFASSVAGAAPVAITNATLHTISGAVIPNGTLVFDNGKIISVGAGLSAPAGATVIDAKGQPVTPGLINSFTRLGVLEVEQIKSTDDSDADSPFFSAGFDVAPGINPRSPMLPIARTGGLTRAITAPDYAKSIFAGQGAMLTLGEGAAFNVTPKVAMFMTVSDTGKRLGGGSRGAVWTFLRQAFADARYLERNRADFDDNRARATVLPRMDLEALLPVLNGTMPLVVDAQRAADISAVIAMASEYKLRVILTGAREGWAVASDIARAKIPVILDPTNNLPTRFDTMGSSLENAAKLHAAGVKIAFAVMGDQLFQNVRNLGIYAGIAAANGLPKDAALAAITKNPAEIWGQPAGVLEVGKAADVVLWDGDPLEATSAPTRAFIAGQEQSLETRQAKLRERYRNLAAPAELGYR
jgi:imidazolonepropionase-like amidohydrolase